MIVPKGFRYSALLLQNLVARTNPSFKRVLEPSSITSEMPFVDDYNRASNSIMVLPYVLALNTLYRVLGDRRVGRTLDLCCGPGHFTRMLGGRAEYEEVVGLDLSDLMLDHARKNVEVARPAGKITFTKKDVSRLDGVSTSSVDVTTFLNGAHHFPTIEAVKGVLQEADRVTKADGAILVMDPIRQKNQSLSDFYVEVGGEDYVKKGLTNFNLDFRNSILASWRVDEFRGVIPEKTSRRWIQVVPFGVPTFQLLVGLPVGQEEPFVGRGLKTEEIKALIPLEYHFDWFMFNLTFRLGKKIRC